MYAHLSIEAAVHHDIMRKQEIITFVQVQLDPSDIQYKTMAVEVAGDGGLRWQE